MMNKKPVSKISRRTLWRIIYKMAAMKTLSPEEINIKNNCVIMMTSDSNGY